jgi:hypothetical protein
VRLLLLPHGHKAHVGTRTDMDELECESEIWLCNQSTVALAAYYVGASPAAA